MVVGFAEESTDGDGNGSSALASTEVRMLTASDAKRLGLGTQEVKS
jgi:hypothetical protein